MALGSRKIMVEILGDASSLEKAFGKAEKSGSSFGRSIGKVGKAAAFAGGAAALGGLFVTLKEGFGEFQESEQVANQTAAALKSTGNAARVTAKHVGDLATKISKYSAIDDEAVQSAENMLLTFTNIRNETGKGNRIFDQATRAVTDVATAMNGGAIPSAEQLRKTSIQVGKALNDPIKGIGALRRIGITFTEKQKAVIEKLVKTGQTAKAQKIVLRELNREFGGSAKAAGDTFAGSLAKLRNTFDELAGKLVARAIPTLKRFADALSDILDIFSGSGPTTQKFQLALERIGLSAESSRILIAGFKQGIADAKTVIVTAFNIMRPIVESFFALFKAQIQLLSDIFHGRWSKIWGDAVNVIKKSVGMWKAVLTAAIKALGGIAFWIGNAILNGIKRGLRPVEKWIEDHVIGPFKRALAWLNSFLDKIGLSGGPGGGLENHPPGGVTRKRGGNFGTVTKKFMNGSLGSTAVPTFNVGAAAAGAGNVFTGATFNFYGVQDMRSFERELAKRQKSRPQRRRGT